MGYIVFFLVGVCVNLFGVWLNIRNIKEGYRLKSKAGVVIGTAGFTLAGAGIIACVVGLISRIAQLHN